MMLERLTRIRRILCVAAHPDDIEIGAGGTLLKLARLCPEACFVFAHLTGDEDRIAEAQCSAAALIPGRVRVEAGGFRDGFLPYQDSAAAKEWLAAFAREKPELVLAPNLDDRHQDHRFAAELAWQLFRNSTIAEYEIPKWEGDRPNCNVIVGLDAAIMNAKVTHLMEHFASQHRKYWYKAETFMAIARSRGIEIGTDFAEGFVVRKLGWH